jgi:hypothetical protein
MQAGLSCHSTRFSRDRAGSAHREHGRLRHGLELELQAYPRRCVHGRIRKHRTRYEKDEAHHKQGKQQLKRGGLSSLRGGRSGLSDSGVSWGLAWQKNPFNLKKIEAKK